MMKDKCTNLNQTVCSSSYSNALFLDTVRPALRNGNKACIPSLNKHGGVMPVSMSQDKNKLN